LMPRPTFEKRRPSLETDALEAENLNEILGPRFFPRN